MKEEKWREGEGASIVWKTYVVVVLAAEVDGVHVHAAIVSPVVSQGDDELHAGLGGGVDDLVEGLDVHSRLAVVPLLEDDLGGAGTLVAVLGKALGVVRGVLVVEAPGAEDLEAGVLGGGEALLDIGLMLRREVCY